MIIRIGLGVLLATEGIYGLISFPGRNQKSPKYMRHPTKLTFGIVRFFTDSEWTEEGLVYRSRFMKWWLLTTLTAIAFMVSVFVL